MNTAVFTAWLIVHTVSHGGAIQSVTMAGMHGLSECESVLAGRAGVENGAGKTRVRFCTDKKPEWWRE